MYPDWPRLATDLVPLPHCDGPKLKPFDFQGPQKIKFLDHLGEGHHARVFKVEIQGCVYALKLFRFVYDEDWLDTAEPFDPDDREAMTAFYHYSEPFSAECRAFGRLQEAGHEELAVQCFGYLLLDEEHERTLMNQFSHLRLDFNGNGDYPGGEDMRSRFLGRDGRPPPLRGIVKAFGQAEVPMRARDARRILRDVVQLQQLGIISIDVAHHQLIDGKFSDFSIAVTTPHYLTTPELNPRLEPKWISAMEFETFQFSIDDYWSFDSMIKLWNAEHEDPKDHLSVYAFPGGYGCQIHYNLRSTPSRERVYSLVDPRRYDWRSSVATNTPTIISYKTDGRRQERQRGAVSKTRQRLVSKPPRWYYDCDSKLAKELKNNMMFSTSLMWRFEDGLIFPCEKK